MKEADKALEGERDAQLLAVKYKYAEQKMMIIDNLIEKEITAIADKVPSSPFLSLPFFAPSDSISCSMPVNVELFWMSW